MKLVFGLNSFVTLFKQEKKIVFHMRNNSWDVNFSIQSNQRCYCYDKFTKIQQSKSEIDKKMDLYGNTRRIEYKI